MPAPITRDLVKAHLGILHAEDDTRLGLICARVIAQVEGYCRRSFSAVVEDAIIILDGGGGALHVPTLPVTEVSEVYDLTAAEIVDDTSYRVDLATGMIFKTLEGAASNWYGRPGDGRYRVTYSHGYAAAPADVVGIMLDYAAALYERPDQSVTSINEGGQSASYGDPWKIAKEALRRYVRPRV